MIKENLLTAEKLKSNNTLSAEMMDFLIQCVKEGKNICICGTPGCGKTTIMNAITKCISDDKSVITIEHVPELEISGNNVQKLTTKFDHNQMQLLEEGKKQKPDYIILDSESKCYKNLLLAMEKKETSYIFTAHAGTSRLLCDVRIPIFYSRDFFLMEEVSEKIAKELQIIVETSVMSDGSRKVTSIVQVDGVSEDGKVNLEELYKYDNSEDKFVKCQN